MREMKDSGIAWNGLIPATWETRRGKYVLSLLSRPVREDDEVITCFRDGQVTLRKNRREEGFTLSDKEIGYQGIESGDLVIHGMDGFAGSIGISDSRGKATPVLNVCDSEEDKRYLMYYLRSMAYNDVFTALATGIRVRSCDLRWKKLSELPYLLPSSQEQAQIVSTIENKSKKVDALIANEQKQIEKLKQYKQSLITEVVTKGLDPSAPMKDSGVEWIGEICERYSVTTIKSLFTIKKEIIGRTPDVVLSITQNGLKIKDISENVGQMANSYDNYQIVAKGDFAMNHMDLLTGGIGISSFNGVTSPDYRVFQLTNTQMNPKYFLYLFQMYYRNKIFYAFGQGAANMGRWRLPAQNFNSMLMPVAPVDEQAEIVSYLDERCTITDSLISIKQLKIDKLNAYKKSLIYEYVTGKKEA